jgi:hypothetical protein
VQKGDWFAVVLAIVFCGVGLVLQSYSQRFARYAGITLIVLGIAGATGWFGYFRGGAEAQAPTGPSINGDCNAFGNNNITCPKITVGPKRRPDQLYRGDQMVGKVDRAVLDPANNKIALTNPRFDADRSDLGTDLEIAGYHINCPTLSFPDSAIGHMVAGTFGVVICDVIGRD